jgi:hypothetical protein
MAFPGNSMAGDAYAKCMEDMKVAIEQWTMAVFGARFGRHKLTLKIGRQTDPYSCGVCVINSIELAMLGSTPFLAQQRFHHRLRYFIMAAKYLTNGKVCPQPNRCGPTYSPPH